MSKRNRARRLQKATGMTYQQALATLEKHAERAAALAHSRGLSLAEADLVLVQGEHAAIEVIDMSEDEDTIEGICERLAARTVARRVFVIDGLRVIPGGRGSLAELPVEAFLAAIPKPEETLKEEKVTEVGEVDFYSLPIEDTGAILQVVYDASSSLGLVRLHALKAVEDLARVIRRERRRAAPFIPPTSGGASGAPAEAWLSVVIKRRRKG